MKDLCNLKNGCLVITNTNEIPFHRILCEISKEKMFIIASSKNFSKEEAGALSNYYEKVIMIDNYCNSAEVELAALEIYEQYGFERIVAPAEDDIIRAGKLRDFFKLKGQSYDSALAFRDKVLMKELLIKGEVKVPNYVELNDPLGAIEFAKNKGFPLIVKPIREQGSKGVHILKDLNELKTFLKEENNLNCAYSTKLEMETFIKGDIYLIDGLVKNDKIIAVWPSKVTGNCVDFLKGKIMGCNLISKENPILPKLVQFASQVIKTLPTPTETAFHLEAFYNDSDEIVICEIASRVGGPRVREMWMEGFNIDLGKTFIRMQAGLPYQTNNITSLELKTICGFVMIPSQEGILDHMEEFCPFPWVVHYFPNLKKIGKLQQYSKQYGDPVASIVLAANSEQEYLERYQQLINWLGKTLKWKSI